MLKKILDIEKINNKHCFIIHRFNCDKCHIFRNEKFNTRASITFVGIMLTSLFALLPFLPNMLEFNSVWATTGGTNTPIYMISTRDGSDPPKGLQGIGYNGKALGDINQLKQDCPTEVAIFVHGWHNDENKAKERLDRVRMSLESNNYPIPLIGLSWNSNIKWDDAKTVAQQDGPKLAHFIIDYVNTCKDQFNKNVNVRLISHSLGARVVLTALDSLHGNPIWKNNGFKIASVHLMGAAVDNEEVSKNLLDISSDSTNANTIKSAFGKAIEGEVVRFYNLFNPEDNVLDMVYPFYEKDIALGQLGMQQNIKQTDKVSSPPYYDINIQNEIEPGRNADGIADTHVVFCYYGSQSICKDDHMIKNWDSGLCYNYFIWSNILESCNVGAGDNHAGYMGFRNIPANGNLHEYDGAIDMVVQHWLTPLQ